MKWWSKHIKQELCVLRTKGSISGVIRVETNWQAFEPSDLSCAHSEHFPSSSSPSCAWLDPSTPSCWCSYLSKVSQHSYRNNTCKSREGSCLQYLSCSEPHRPRRCRPRHSKWSKCPWWQSGLPYKAMHGGCWRTLMISLRAAMTGEVDLVEGSNNDDEWLARSGAQARHSNTRHSSVMSCF